MLDRAAEGVHRNRLAVLGRVNRRVRRFHDTRTFERGDLYNFAPELPGQFLCVDLVAILADNIHHVDRDDHRDAQLGQLRCQVQVAFQIRAVDDVQNRVRALLDQVVSCDDFFQRIGRKRVDTRKVGDDHAIMLFELAFLLFHGNTRPVSDKLVRPRKCIKQCGFTTVGVACKGNS